MLLRKRYYRRMTMSPYMKAYEAGIKLAQLEWFSKRAADEEDGTDQLFHEVDQVGDIQDTVGEMDRLDKRIKQVRKNQQYSRLHQDQVGIDQAFNRAEYARGLEKERDTLKATLPKNYAERLRNAESAPAPAPAPVTAPQEGANMSVSPEEPNMSVSPEEPNMSVSQAPAPDRADEYRQEPMNILAKNVKEQGQSLEGGARQSVIPQAPAGPPAPLIEEADPVMREINLLNDKQRGAPAPAPAGADESHQELMNILAKNVKEQGPSLRGAARQTIVPRAPQSELVRGEYEFPAMPITNSTSTTAPEVPPAPRFDYMAQNQEGMADPDDRFNVQAGNYRKQFNRFREQFGGANAPEAFQGLNYRDFAGALGNRGLRVGDSLGASDIMARLQQTRQDNWNRENNMPLANRGSGAGLSPLDIQNRRGNVANRGSLAAMNANRRNPAPANVNPFGGLMGARAQRKAPAPKSLPPSNNTSIPKGPVGPGNIDQIVGRTSTKNTDYDPLASMRQDPNYDPLASMRQDPNYDSLGSYKTNNVMPSMGAQGDMFNKAKGRVEKTPGKLNEQQKSLASNLDNMANNYKKRL
jgi:hypothetical protein